MLLKYVKNRVWHSETIHKSLYPKIHTLKLNQKFAAYYITNNKKDKTTRVKLYGQEVVWSDKTKIKLFGYNDQRYKETLYIYSMVLMVL